ncbi:MAG: TerD family protein [Campylobacterota bacterium]|nr:TerD family protein [Campylobacterota bacterium]
MAVNLSKGQKISLKKSNGSDLTSFCVGANWGAIDKKGFFGGTSKQAVDLDLSVGMFDANKNTADVIYFGKLEASGVRHSGDDTTGDVDGDDGLDNEVVQINLSQIPANVDQLVFILNSFQGQDFATIPFASIRLYEGTPSSVNDVVATYNIASDAQFAGSVSMVLGKLYRRNGEWKFSAIGEPTKDAKLEQTIQTVQQKYL